MLNERQETHEETCRILIGVSLFNFTGINVPHIHEKQLEHTAHQLVVKDYPPGVDTAPELGEISLYDVPLVGLQMEDGVGFDIDIALGRPDLLRVVKIEERIGNQEEIGIEIGRIAHVGDERRHLPDHEIAGTCREGPAHCLEVHLPASA